MYSLIDSKIDLSKISQLVVKLGYLLKECDLQIDSRKVGANSIFCAYKGISSDGRDFIANARQSGARCIIQDGDFNLSEAGNYYIENLRDIVGILASIKNQIQFTDCLIIGVTGTNGKTSITQWLAQVGSTLKKKVAIIGTLGSGIYPDLQNTAATTPNPIIVQDLLAEFTYRLANWIAMEVSSHALDQGRVNGTQFHYAVFTNLTQDHLDYHQDMESYYLAKKQLFFWQNLRGAIINIDDNYGKRLYHELNQFKPTYRVMSYAIEADADIVAKNLKISVIGSQFTLCYNNQSINLNLKTVGLFNIYNVLALIGVLINLGYKLGELVELLAAIHPVKGRMETLIFENKPLIVVDYAHTPDALEKVLINLRQIEHSGKLYCVFGCGGNRDSGKRPLMGKIAVDNADYTIITSDNPRNENPHHIIEQVVAGISGSLDKYTSEVNRKQAINLALQMAQANDIVLIAGKGHEEYQEINGIKESFSDIAIAQELLTIKGSDS